MRTFARPRDVTEIQERLKRLRSDTPRRWGRMSAHQMVCHLCDSALMALGHRPVALTATLAQRTILKWVVLYVPIPWPKGVPTSREIDQECDGTRPATFAHDLEHLESLVAEMATPVGLAPSHPVFGRMTPADWHRWAYLHMDHHLRQFGL